MNISMKWKIAKDGVYGDEIMVYWYLANLFDVEIIIISTLGNGGRASIPHEILIPLREFFQVIFQKDRMIINYVCLDQVNNQDIDKTDGDKMDENDENKKGEADGYDMGQDDRDKMDKTDGETMDEAKGYSIDKDEGDKTDQDDEDKIDEADGDKIYKADEDKMSKPNSTQNTIHGLEMLSIKILEKIFVMFSITSNFEFPTHVCWKFNNLIAAFPKLESLQNIDIRHLSRIHVSHASFLPIPKRNGELNVNLQ